MYPQNFFLTLPFMVILFATSGYALTTKFENNIYNILPIAIASLIAALLYRRRVNIKSLLPTYFFLFLVVMIFLSAMKNLSAENLIAATKLLLVITFSYLCFIYFSPTVLLRSFVNSLTVLALISLIVYAYVNFTQSVPMLGAFKNINDMGYYNGYLFFVFEENYLWFRNTSIFWEPGIYGSYIYFALAMVMFFNLGYSDRSKAIIIFVLVIAAWTTVSTATYFLVFPLTLLYIFYGYRAYTRWILITFLLLPVFLLVGYNLADVVIALSKFAKPIFGIFVNADLPSVYDRIHGPMVNLEIFGSEPLFGHGLYNASVMFTAQFDGAQTSTSTYYLAAFGLPGIVLTLGWLYAGGSVNAPVIVRYFMVLSFIVILNKEPHTYFSLTYLFLFLLLGSQSNGRRHEYLD